jgi:hypothetical protein
VERRLRRQHCVRSLKDLAKGLGVREATVCDCVKVREVDDGADPARACRDREDVVGGAEFAHATHDLHAEGNRAVLLHEPLA